MPKLVGSIVKIFGVLILLLLIAAILIPILYKTEIFNLIKNKANENINGKVEFKNLNLSLIKNFPKLSISIQDLDITSYVNNDTNQLFKAKELNLHVDIWNLISKTERLDIKGFDLVDPIIDIRSFSNGQSNYNLSNSASSEKDSTPIYFKLSSYSISNGTVKYQDSSSLLSLENLNHKGVIDISSDFNELKTTTSISKLNYNSEGTILLKNVSLTSALDLSIDNINKIYTLKKNEIVLNALKIILEGKFKDLSNDDYDLDLHLKAPGNEFKELFSLIPGTFTSDYMNIQSGGSFMLDATFKGIYNSSNQTYPNWDIKTKVDNGSIQYKNMPMKLDRVNIDLQSINSTPDLTNLNIKLNPFSFYLNNTPIDGKLFIDNLKNNPHIVSAIHGKINLDDFKNFIPLDNNTDISGRIDLNIDLDFFESQVQNSKFDEIKLNGSTQISNLKYKTIDMPLIVIKDGNLQFSPQQCQINTLAMNLGKSDMNLTGSISNPLALVNEGSQYGMNINLHGDLFDANEFLSDETNSAAMPEPSTVPDIIARGNINFVASYNHLLYDTYKIKNAKTSGSLNKSILSMNPLSMNINSNEVSGKILLNNVMDFVYKNQVLTGSLVLNSPYFDANKFMATDVMPSPEAQTSEPFLVPEGMNIDVSFTTPGLLYDKLELKNFISKLTVVKDEIQIKELTTSSMGGSMALSGIYNSSNPEKPIFDMKYDMNKLQFSRIFESIKTFQILAPIAKFMEGQFNSSFIFSGALSKDMSPEIGSINVSGIFETIDAAIKNYPPLEAIATKLNVKEIKNLNLKNTKNWFNIENGQVTIKELNYKIGELDLAIAGNSKIQGPMDYNFKFRIPRNKLNQNVVGQSAENGLNYLKGLGNKVGVNIEQGSHVNVLVNLTGKLLSPDIKFKLLGSDGQSIEESGKDIVSNVVDNAKDSLRKRVEQEVDKSKEKAIKEAQRIEDSIKAVVVKKIEEEKNKVLSKAEQEAKKHIDSNLVNKGKEILKEKIGNKTDDILNDSTTEKIKEKMKDWNPFKKKK